MSLLKALREAKVNPKGVGTRKFTVLDRDMDLPEFWVRVRFLPQDEFDRAMAPYRKRGEVFPVLNASQRAEFRKKVLPRIVEDWGGCVKGNVERMSEDAFLAPDALAALPSDEEVEYSADAVLDLAWLMNNDVFNRILDAAMDQDVWIAERRAVVLSEPDEKKDSTSTPA